MIVEGLSLEISYRNFSTKPPGNLCSLPRRLYLGQLFAELGTFAETAIVDYCHRLPTKENKRPFSLFRIETAS